MRHHYIYIEAYTCFFLNIKCIYVMTSLGLWDFTWFRSYPVWLQCSFHVFCNVCVWYLNAVKVKIIRKWPLVLC